MAKKHKSRRLQTGGGAEDVNLTPMIDCTFQLIIFFVLTAQMASQTTKLIVPHPYQTVAVKPEEGGPALPNRVVVSVANKYGDKKDKERDPADAAIPQFYRIGSGNSIAIGDMDTLVREFQARKAASAAKGFNPDDFVVEIRADKDVAFGGIEPVMQAAAQADINKMAITAIATNE
jgi:biopolymer transport protein ExbD